MKKCELKRDLRTLSTRADDRADRLGYVTSKRMTSVRMHFQSNLVKSEQVLTVSLLFGRALKACLSWSKMGARTTKMEHRKKEGNHLGSSHQKRPLKMAKKKIKKPDEGDVKMNFQGSDETQMKKKTLQELHMDPPPAFRKFESEVDWQNMDHGIALQLWEDVFKPLYTFYVVRPVSPTPQKASG